ADGGERSGRTPAASWPRGARSWGPLRGGARPGRTWGVKGSPAGAGPITWRATREFSSTSRPRLFRRSYAIDQPLADGAIQLPVDLGVLVEDVGRAVVTAIGLPVQHRDELHVGDAVLGNADRISVASKHVADRCAGAGQRQPLGLPVGGNLFRGAPILRGDTGSARPSTRGGGGRYAVARVLAAEMRTGGQRKEADRT